MKQKLFTLLAAAGVASAFVMNAVPAKKVFIDLPQPDGTTVKVMRVGDEYNHYYLSEDGVPMLTGGDGLLHFVSLDNAGKIVLSEIKAADVARRSPAARAAVAEVDVEAVRGALDARRSPRRSPNSGVGLFSTSFPRTGDIRGLVILVEYSDYKFQVSNPASYFGDMLNLDGFNSYGGTGCAAEYFREQSGNQFRPVFDVLGPVTLPNKRSYYGGNDYWGDDRHPEEMVIDACDILDDQVDFSLYDMDNDGVIDNVFVFYAGQGEASYGSEDTVWPHSWEISESAGITKYYDGKLLNRYACSNEWEQSRPDGVGTFIHEFSHVMGLPDLYHTTSGSATYTPGAWSVMDYGPYNNDGCTPPNYSAYERNALGWIEPHELTQAESIVLNPITSGEACIYSCSQNEFFLFENRQQEGWDAYLPGHGMLIWHVDFDQYVWDNNTVNNTSSRQRVDIVEAGGTANSSSATTMASYPWPGTRNKTSFTSSTSPAFKTQSGLPIDMPVTDITESPAGIISFDVLGGNRELTPPEDFVADAREDGTVVFTWQPVDFANDYLLDVYTREDDVVCFVQDLHTGDVSAYVLDGTVSGTRYFATLRAVSGTSVSDPCAEIMFTTPELGFSFTAPVTLEAEDVSGKGFTARWEPLEGAVGYLLTVSSTVEGEPRTDNADFGTPGTTTLELPDGWNFDGTASDLYTKTSSNMSGAAVPSLKFSSKTDQALTTCIYETPVKSIVFWAKGASSDDSNSFEVMGRTGEDAGWESLYVIQPLDNSIGTTHTLADIPEGVRQVRFVYHKVAAGNVALDDVEIVTDGNVAAVLDGYDGLEVGDVTSYPVNVDNAASTLYSYTVTGINAGGELSKVSMARDVDLSNSNSGTGKIDVPEGSVLTVRGREVVYIGEAGATVVVYSADGKLVAREVASASGDARVTLPSAGVYLVHAPGAVIKAVVR